VSRPARSTGRGPGGRRGPASTSSAEDPAPRTDPTWEEFWRNQRGWKRHLHLDKSTHYGFTDLQFAVPQLGALIDPARRAALIGTVGPGASLAAQHDYLAAYFDLHLKGRDRNLFDGPSRCHPAVAFIG
jgi:hypothetical protein